MNRFLRSERLRWRLWKRAGGKCQRCGLDLPEGWHADHVIPWSVSRRTDANEMQALCPTCNLRKGARMDLATRAARAHQLCDQLQNYDTAMRSHQKETLRFIRGIATGLAGGSWPALQMPGFLVEEIVPGGGKSWNAVMATSVLVGSGLFDVAFWMSPRLSLLDQAREDFSSTSLGMRFFGKRIPIFNPANIIPMELTKKLERLDRHKDVKAWVMSYQRLREAVLEEITKVAESRRVLLILDEFQLLADPEVSGRRQDDIDGPMGWSAAVDGIIKACHKNTGFGAIVLSGGLYRNDNRELPYIAYRQGDINAGENPNEKFPIADVRYTLSEAQRDRAITKIDFDYYKGEVEFSWDGQDGLETVEDMTKERYGSKIRGFLQTEEVWQSVLLDMLNSLDHFNPPGNGYRARYIVVSMDTSECDKHAAYLESIGRKPLKIHSNMSDKEIRLLQDFRRGAGEWDGLVSVAMGYIGLSIPDLSHMAYLTHYRSLSWWNQAVHRITRTDYHPRAPIYENQLARVFCPKDPMMLDMSNRIMSAQNPGVLALPRPKIPVCFPPTGPGTPGDFEALSASITGREFNTNGYHCTEHDFIDEAIKAIPQLNAVTRKVVEDFKKFGDQFRS